jgi:hypothetical protein
LLVGTAVCGSEQPAREWCGRGRGKQDRCCPGSCGSRDVISATTEKPANEPTIHPSIHPSIYPFIHPSSIHPFIQPASQPASQPTDRPALARLSSPSLPCSLTHSLPLLGPSGVRLQSASWRHAGVPSGSLHAAERSLHATRDGAGPAAAREGAGHVQRAWWQDQVSGWVGGWSPVRWKLVAAVWQQQQQQRRRRRQQQQQQPTCSNCNCSGSICTGSICTDSICSSSSNYTAEASASSPAATAAVACAVRSLAPAAASAAAKPQPQAILQLHLHLHNHNHRRPIFDWMPVALVPPTTPAAHSLHRHRRRHHHHHHRRRHRHRHHHHPATSPS